jgi:SHS2 domain-containing protein
VSFEFLDHTGDVGFVAEAPTLDGLLAEAVAAFVATVTEPERIESRETRAFTVTAEAPDLLVHGVLEEVLFRFEVGGFLPRIARATVTEHGREWQAELEVSGERRDAVRHPVKVLVKAITYHALAVERAGAGWRAKVIFDL